MIVTCQHCKNQLPIEPSLNLPKVRCGACKSIVTIPGSRPARQTSTPVAKPSVKAAPTAPKPSPASLTVICVCKAKMTVAPNLRGKKVQCPTCRQQVLVPDPNAPTQPAFTQISLPTSLPPASALTQNPYRIPGSRPAQNNQPIVVTAILGGMTLLFLIVGFIGFQLLQDRSSADPESIAEASPGESLLTTDASTAFDETEIAAPANPAPHAASQQARAPRADSSAMQPESASPTLSRGYSESSDSQKPKDLPAAPVSKAPMTSSDEARPKNPSPAPTGGAPMTSSDSARPQTAPQQPMSGAPTDSSDGSRPRASSRNSRSSASPAMASDVQLTPYGPVDESGLRRFHFPDGFSIALPNQFNVFGRSTSGSTMNYFMASDSGYEVVVSLTDNNRITPTSPSPVSTNSVTRNNGKLIITPKLSQSNPNQLEVVELDGMRARFATMQADLSHGDRTDMVNRLFSGAVPSDVKHQLQGKLKAKVQFKSAYMMEVMDHKRIIQIMVSKVAPQPIAPSSEWFEWLRTFRHEAQPNQNLIPAEFLGR